MKKLGTIALSADILKKANIGLWAFELDEGCAPRMYADEAMMGLIGLEKEVSPEETYHAWYDNIDKAHYDEVHASVEKMTSGTHAEVQYPWHHPNGETWVVRCGGVRNFAYTKGIRIEGTHQNITALTHYEKRNLTDLLASLADNFLQVYFLNPYTGSFSSYAGNAFDEDKDRDYSTINFYEDVAVRSGMIVHPDDKVIIDKMYSREKLTEILESGRTEEFIIRWPIEEGKRILYMNNRLVPYEDDDGTKKIVIGITDVTKEKMAEKALEEKNAYLEHFLKSFKSAYIVDLNSDRFEILHMDSDIADIFNSLGGKKDMEEYIDHHIHPEDRELMKRISDSTFVKSQLKIKNEMTFTVREVFEDTEKTMRVLIMRGADNTRAAVGFMDISDEIAKEKEYSHTLEAANRAKSSFLFNMSHDIRTPMNAIIGFSEMAKKHIEDRTKVEDCLEKVLTSGKHLLNLINDVLDMARIESGKMQIDNKIINFAQLGNTVRTITEESAKEKNITVEYNIAFDENIYVYGDELKLNQVTLNIMSNAIKYTPSGGKIVLSTYEIPNDNPDYFVYDMVVEDNGIGMSKEFLEKIFVPFERSASSTKSGIQGTGLGMAITKELVERMGGTIQVESELGVGTKVTVRWKHLRIRDTDMVNHIKENDIEGFCESKGRKVLLVEDNELNREIATEILEEAGMIVQQAEDGDIAVEKMKNANENQYDLILMDVQMPRMDGYEATREIRKLQNQAVANIPIIAMTANAFEEDKRNALEAGMNGHISKPIDVEDLMKTLSKVLKS